MSKRDFDLYFSQLEEAEKRLGFRVSQSVVDQFIQINVVSVELGYTTSSYVEVYE